VVGATGSAYGRLMDASVLDAAAERLCRRSRLLGWRELGVEGARFAVESDGTLATAPPVPVDVEDIALGLEASGPLPVRIYRPAGADGTLPAVVYLHGAGWVFEASRAHDGLARLIAGASGGAVLMPACARSPEAGFPVALEQCYGVLDWIADRGSMRALDPGRIAVIGDGSGATLAAGAAMLAAQRDGPSLAAQVLICPATDPACDTPSHREFGERLNLRSDDVRWLWEQYLAGRERPLEPLAAPLHAPCESLAGLAPALVITAEADVLRDEGERYAARLRAAGVDVLAVRYLGMIHGFCHLDTLRETAAARAAVEQVVTFLAQRLGTS
jgi:acetyl esterase